MKQYFQAVVGLYRAYQLRFYRDKVAMFFTYLFPLIFLLIFGSIFTNSDPRFKIAILNQSDSQVAVQFVEQVQSNDTFTIDETITNLDTAKERMTRGELDSVIVLPDAFGEPGADGRPTGQMTVYYKTGTEQPGRTVAAVMEQSLEPINRELGQTDPQFTVAQAATEQNALRQFDYTFAGLLGFTMLSTAIFGLASVLPAEKQRGSYRRLRASPLRASQLIMANAMHYLTNTLISILLMVIVGLIIFDVQNNGSWWQFGVYAVISSIMMLGFGLLIGGWAKNENQAAPIANLVAFPLMFLSGVFFPRFLFPEWLQGITSYIPLSPVVDGFRRILTENAQLAELAPELSIIVGWGIVVYFGAIKLFRWE